MKQNLLFLLCLLFSISAAAQNAPVDFEPGGEGANWTWTVFENDTNPPLEFMANPDPTGANTSATVAKFTALQAGMPFAGCESMRGSDIGAFTLDSSTSVIKIMVWKPVISDVGIKLVQNDGGALPEIKVPNTKTNEWEEISFDFSSREGIEYNQIVIFPDFNARAQDNIIYFDNITFNEQTSAPTVPASAAPDPTVDPDNVISMFSNVYDDVPVDTWLTPWSQGTLADIQIDGNDTKRYDALNFIGVETLNNLIDASAMEYFHIDIWTPNLTQFRVKLVDAGADETIGTGDDSEHEITFTSPAQGEWISYKIPLSDFTGLTSRENIGQLILAGMPVGSGTVYVDNVYYSSSAVAVSEPEVKAFSLTPNPGNNLIQIEAASKIENIRIFNLMGQECLFRQPQALENGSTIDISHLESGTYILSVTINGVTSSTKLMKM